ncbi:MAG: excinuclease ABC subunit UvrC [Candidatus Omnitrophica bacterium]|nr:excinuclease ABC subunit UvrC [Candidatus Omnitrophota bacterium]
MFDLKKIKNKISNIPDTAGVYLMKDAAGNIIYVGKAKSLKKRLSSYFSKNLSSKTLALMSHVEDIEFIQCPNEAMALLLEASLVHKNNPKYNVLLRDDKSFPLVKITREDFPAVFVTRKKDSDGAQYLGPFMEPALLREALKIIRRIFKFRSCRNMPDRACIYNRIHLCPGPCIGKISKQDYVQVIKKIILALEGKSLVLVENLTKEMNQKALNLNFEAAAEIRNQISALSSIGRSKVIFDPQTELEDLRNLLELKELPRRIETFDISNIHGKQATGSMVSFWMARPDKNNYRRFKIKSVKEIDDYSMLAEVVRRRYMRVISEKIALPDLILIDGGRAHLLTAQKELTQLGLEIPLASIAKERENIYIKERAYPIRLKGDSPALNLIRRMRDEAHRFAIKYHHFLRNKKAGLGL